MLHRSLALLLLASLSALAQYTSGRVEGKAIDPSGASISDCKITLLSKDTNSSRGIATSETGLYAFSAVMPGEYQLTAEKTGFRKVTVDIIVNTTQTTTQNFRLEVGEQPITMTVSATADALLNTTDPLRQVTRDSVELANLPNASRNVINVVTLSPGVTPTFSPRGGNLTTLSIAQAGQINSNGGRSKATSHQLDSTDANDWEFGGFALSTQPNPDMLREFQILTNNWGAEYGVKSNAQVLMVTKSGTNQFHGTAYNYLQNKALNSRDWFDRTGSATPLRQNFFGFTAGGAVVKDRVFVFGGYEGRRTRGAGSTFLANLPTAAARARATDPAVVEALRLLPLPTSPTANPDIGTNAVVAASPSNANMFLTRGDVYLNKSHQLTFRYFQNVANSFSRTAGSLPGFDATFDPKGRNAMVADLWVINANTTNELRASYGRASALFSPETDPATPRFNVAGLVGFGTVQSWPQGRIFNVYQLSNTLSHNRGRHSLKAGIDLREIQDNSVNDSSRRGVFTFTSLNTLLAGTPSLWTQVFGNTYRGFRTRYPGFFVQDSYKLTSSLTLNIGLRWEYQGGLREVNRLQAVLDPRVPGNIGQAGSGPLGTFRSENPIVEGNPGLVAPRFGFAWNPNSSRLVVRGGYGIYYDSFLFNSLQAGRTTPPINYTGSLAGAQITGTNSFGNLLNGTGAIQTSLRAQLGNFGTLPNFGSITTTKPDLRNPYAQHFSLGVQYRVTNNIAADLSYVGTRGNSLTTFGPWNSLNPANRPAVATSAADETARLAQFQTAFARTNGNTTTPSTRLDPRFNDVNLVGDFGNSNYHSFQALISRSFAQGLQLRASYTWSKSIDNASDYSPGQATTDRSFAQDQFNLRGERGVSTFDIRHRLTISHVWMLPFFKSQKGLAGRVLGGWLFSSINQMQTGIPFTVLSGPRLGITDVNLDGNASGAFDNARANCAVGGSFTLGLPGQFVNTTYSQPFLGNNGTCGRNTGRMANLFNYDWTFSKNFRLSERGPLGLEYRADLFNIFNTRFLTTAGDNFRAVSDPGFGIFNAAGSTRRIQMSLRLVW